MEARATVSRTGISRFFVGAVLVIVAIGLGIMAAYLAANLTGVSGTTQSAPSTVTRHENSQELDQAPAANDEAPANVHLGHRMGGALEE